MATISTDDDHQLKEFRASVGAQWPFLSDPGRIVQKDLDIQEYTDPENDPMIPHTLVLKPGLVIHSIYNGYWFWGRPSVDDLRHDLRTVTREIRPDWDLERPWAARGVGRGRALALPRLGVSAPQHPQRSLGVRFIVAAALALSLAMACIATSSVAAADAIVPESPVYLQLAEKGVAVAKARWGRGGWYEERLGDRDRYPLATIWGIAPLFETLDAIQLAAPSAAHRAAVETFATGAERYYNRQLRPTPGYAPYPNDRGQPRTWFDDNGWWGLGFIDAYRATHDARFLRDAERAFKFIAAQGWDRHAGGIWWNTAHPYKSGPALAADTLLGAMLYRETGRVFYLGQVQKFLRWADADFLTDYRLYSQNNHDGTPTPYVEGPLVEAHQILCERGQRAACERAKELADACWARFQDRLNMGPQFDTIYLHWMLAYAAQTGDRRWVGLASTMAARAKSNASTASNLYLRAWDGGSITEHEAESGMLQTDAATLELFASLGQAATI